MKSKSTSSSKRTVRVLKFESRDVIEGGCLLFCSPGSLLALPFETTEDIFLVSLSVRVSSNAVFSLASTGLLLVIDTELELNAKTFDLVLIFLSFGIPRRPVSPD